MTETDDAGAGTRVLVPVKILEGGSIPAGLVDLLASVDVTVLGYHVLPEQTPPEQARVQFEERATEALADVASEFRAAGTDADHRLVFTHDREQTIDRVADAVGARAFAITGPTGPVERLLVPLTGKIDVENLLSFVEELIADREIEVTLLFAGGETDEVRSLLDGAAGRLEGAGINARTLVVHEDPFDAILEAVPGHDAVVMGERGPSLRSLVLGDEAERVAAASVGPVLVVRRECEKPEDSEDD